MHIISAIQAGRQCAFLGQVTKRAMSPPEALGRKRGHMAHDARGEQRPHLHSEDTMRCLTPPADRTT